MPTPRLANMLAAMAGRSTPVTPRRGEWIQAYVTASAGNLADTYQVLAAGRSLSARSSIDAPLEVGDTVFIVMEGGAALIVGKA